MRLANPLALRPMRLLRIPEPFDDPDWLYEVKFDAFRAGACQRPPLRADAMHIILILTLMAAVQPIVAPIRPCPVVVDVVDPGWAPLPGITVTLRDERTRTEQTAMTDETGATRFTVQTCADDRCRFTVSARHAEFKTVTLKRLWFGDNHDLGRRVQIRLREFTRGAVPVR